MNQKDYKEIAKILKDGGDYYICRRLADYFDKTKSDFNQQQFLKMCGVK